MAKKQKETAIEEVAEQPKVDDKVEKIQVKKKPSMKKFNIDSDSVTKVDLAKPLKKEEDIISKQKTEETSLDKTSEDSKKIEEKKSVVEEVEEIDTEEKVDDIQDGETPVLEEVTEDNIEEKKEELTTKSE